MNYRFNYFPLFGLWFILFLFLSCSTDPIINSDKIETFYYVQCLLIHDQIRAPAQRLSLTRLRSLVDLAMDGVEEFGEEGADVRIVTPDSTVNFIDVGRGNYESPVFAKRGERYRLEIITKEGYEIRAETTIPDSITFLDFIPGDTLYIEPDSLDWNPIIEDMWIPPYAVSSNTVVLHYVKPFSEFRPHPFYMPDKYWQNTALFYAEDCFKRTYLIDDYLQVYVSIDDSTVTISSWSLNPAMLDTCPPEDGYLEFEFCDIGYYYSYENGAWQNIIEDLNDDENYLNISSNIHGGYGQFGSWPVDWELPFIIVSKNRNP